MLERLEVTRTCIINSNVSVLNERIRDIVRVLNADVLAGHSR